MLGKKLINMERNDMESWSIHYQLPLVQIIRFDDHFHSNIRRQIAI